MSPESLPVIPGGWTRQTIDLGKRSVSLDLPAAPDDFLDDADVLRANRESDYMPYWAYLWPAATTMARLVLQEEWPVGSRALEIGCGVGLVGIAAGLAGLDVTFSDYDANAVGVACRNARHQGLHRCQGTVIDWRDLDSVRCEPFPVLLGCDVIYENASLVPVLNVLDALLAEGGTCWIGDPGRSYVPAFCQAASERGYDIELRDGKGDLIPTLIGFPSVAVSRFRLLVLKRK